MVVYKKNDGDRASAVENFEMSCECFAEAKIKLFAKKFHRRERACIALSFRFPFPAQARRALESGCNDSLQASATLMQR
jgi:hypothetical protein